MSQTFIWSIDDVIRKLWRRTFVPLDPPLLRRFMTYGHSRMRSVLSSGVSAKSINFDYAPFGGREADEGRRPVLELKLDG